MNASLHKKGNMYYAVISVPAGNGKFKTKWVSTHCHKNSDATKTMRDILTRMENGMFEQTCPYTFMEYMDYWLKNVIKPQIEVTTYEGYVSNYKLHILPYFQPLNLKLDQLRVGHFQQFVNDLHHHGRKDGEGGLSTASIRKYMGNITKALNHAIRVGWLTQNPASYVEYPRSKPFVGSFYTTDKIERLLDAVRGHAIETPIILATHYGLRHIRLHDLRHSTASYLNKLGFSPKEIQIWLGHSDISTTVNVRNPHTNKM